MLSISSSSKKEMILVPQASPPVRPLPKRCGASIELAQSRYAQSSVSTLSRSRAETRSFNPKRVGSCQ